MSKGGSEGGRKVKKEGRDEVKKREIEESKEGDEGGRK